MEPSSFKPKPDRTPQSDAPTEADRAVRNIRKRRRTAAQAVAFGLAFAAGASFSHLSVARTAGQSAYCRVDRLARGVVRGEYE
jgi:hypothetical protein